MMHLTNTYSEKSACPRFAIQYLKEGINCCFNANFWGIKWKIFALTYMKKYFKLLLLGSICLWLDSYSNPLTSLLHHTLQWMERITRLHFSQNHSSKILWLPILNVPLEGRGEGRNMDGKQILWEILVESLILLPVASTYMHFYKLSKLCLHPLSL